MRLFNKREKRLVAGMVLAAVLLVGYVLTRFPGVQKVLILREHRQAELGYSPRVFDNGFGWAQRSQLYSQDLGPVLLRDKTVVEQRQQELATHSRAPGEIPGDWALVFAARRLQGQSNQQILAGPDGLRLTLATMVAEADPPAWWSRSPWLAEQAKCSPRGSFRMGLLGPSDVEPVMSRLGEAKEKELFCYVRCVLRHDDGFTLEHRDAVLATWKKAQGQYYSPNNVISVDRALHARLGLKELLASQGAPGGKEELTLQLAYPEHVGALERKHFEQLFRDFLRSLGYRTRVVPSGGTVTVLVQFGPVNFESVEVKHYEPYTATERVSRRIYGGKYSGYRTEWENRTVTRNKTIAETGAADVVSWVATVQAGTSEVMIALPPYSDVSRDTQERTLSYLEDFTKVDHFYWNYYLRNDASRPWRFGLVEREFDDDYEEFYY